MNNRKGMALIETMIAIFIMLFVSFVSFSTFSSILINSDLIVKKMNLSNKLDERISEYRISGVFDDSTFGDMNFSQEDVSDQGSNYSTYSFTATYSDDSFSLNSLYLEKDI